jgi:hypothetical protein
MPTEAVTPPESTMPPPPVARWARVLALLLTIAVLYAGGLMIRDVTQHGVPGICLESFSGKLYCVKSLWKWVFWAFPIGSMIWLYPLFGFVAETGRPPRRWVGFPPAAFSSRPSRPSWLIRALRWKRP